MAFTSADRAYVEQLDTLFQANAPLRNLGRSKNQLKQWYSRMLGSLRMMLGDEEIVFTHVDYTSSTDTARYLVFTPHRLVVVDVAGIAGAPTTTPRSVSRRSIRWLDVQSLTQWDVTDQLGSGPATWPGSLRVEVQYAALTGPVTFRAMGHNPDKPEVAPAGLRLVEGLRRDLIDAAV